MKSVNDKNCVLYDRACINCGECEICDLNPDKICDNCGKCISSDEQFREFKLSSLISDELAEHSCGCEHNHDNRENIYGEHCDCDGDIEEFEEYELDLGSLTKSENLDDLMELLKEFDLDGDLEDIDLSLENLDILDDFDDYDDYNEFDDEV